MRGFYAIQYPDGSYYSHHRPYTRARRGYPFKGTTLITQAVQIATKPMAKRMLAMLSDLTGLKLVRIEYVVKEV